MIHITLLATDTFHRYKLCSPSVSEKLPSAAQRNLRLSETRTKLLGSLLFKKLLLSKSRRIWRAGVMARQLVTVADLFLSRVHRMVPTRATKIGIEFAVIYRSCEDR